MFELFDVICPQQPWGGGYRNPSGFSDERRCTQNFILYPTLPGITYRGAA